MDGYSKSFVESSTSQTLDTANTFILVAHITMGLGGLFLWRLPVVCISLEFCKLERLLGLLPKSMLKILGQKSLNTVISVKDIMKHVFKIFDFKEYIFSMY